MLYKISFLRRCWIYCTSFRSDWGTDFNFCPHMLSPLTHTSLLLTYPACSKWGIAWSIITRIFPFYNLTKGEAAHIFSSAVYVLVGPTLLHAAESCLWLLLNIKLTFPKQVTTAAVLVSNSINTRDSWFEIGVHNKHVRGRSEQTLKHLMRLILVGNQLDAQFLL